MTKQAAEQCAASDRATVRSFISQPLVELKIETVLKLRSSALNCLYGTTLLCYLVFTDFSESEWHLIEPVLPSLSSTGRPRRWDLRLIINAIFYQLKSGCPWRLLPREYPPWQTVYSCFRKWRDDGTWEHVHARLREKLRRAVGRVATPSGAVLDSQSVKTSEKGGLVATMASRGLMAASAICWSILKAWCSKRSCHRHM